MKKKLSDGDKKMIQCLIERHSEKSHDLRS